MPEPLAPLLEPRKQAAFRAFDVITARRFVVQERTRRRSREHVLRVMFPIGRHAERAARFQLARNELDEVRLSIAVVRRKSCSVHAHNAGCRAFCMSLPLSSFLTTDHRDLVTSNG